MKKRHIWIWAPVIVFYSLITFMSGLSGEAISFLTRYYPFAGFDKVAHFTEYFILGVLLTRALTWEEYQHRLRRHWYVYFVSVIPVMSFVDEIHQFFIPQRSMDIFDWLADMSGAACGALVVALVMRIRQRRNAEDGETPTEQRDIRSDQRVRYVLPPVIAAIVIQFLFTRENLATGDTRLMQFMSYLPHDSRLPFLHAAHFWQGALFFVFGILYFRFLFWEAGGRASSQRLTVWLTGFAVFLFISLWDSVFPAVLNGLGSIFVMPYANFAGGILAFALCSLTVMGLRLLESVRAPRQSLIA